MTTSAQVELESRLSEIATEDFITKRIYPLLPELSGRHSDGSNVRAKIVRNIGTPRATVEYQIGDHVRVFAKLYSDNLGAHSYAVLKSLWDDGFGREEKYQIPQPLSYSPDDKLLIMRSVDGTDLSSYIGSNERGLIEGARGAARWLAKLHSSTIRVGREGDFSAELLRLSNRLIKAVGQHPEEWEMLLDLTEQLRELARAIPEKRKVAQIHGRFHHDHIFVGSDSVALIDWDLSCPSDPAIDLAEFLHLLRSKIFKETGNAGKAEEPARAFLEEYLSRLPDCPGNLTFYWAFNILFTLSRSIKKRRRDDAESNAKINFYHKEFESVISGRFMW